MNTYEVIPQFGKMLRNLDMWLEKASVHAKSKSFDPDVLVGARLAPDQYTLAQQVQSVCDAAKFTAAYFSGKEAPKHPDTEKTMAELRERIQKCVTFLETVSEKDCTGADTKKISPAWLKGKWVQGDHYALQIAIPNFYFHIATAYSILRHNGVELGKMDFIGNVPMRDA